MDFAAQLSLTDVGFFFFYFSAMFVESFHFYYTEKFGVSNKSPAFALPCHFQPTFKYPSIFWKHNLLSAIALSP